MNNEISLANNHLAPTTKTASHTPTVLVWGAGATGLFAVEGLLEKGFRVMMVNEDAEPGGGTRYYIRPDKDVNPETGKLEMKLVYAKRYLEVLKHPNFVGYYGKVRIANDGQITPDEVYSRQPDAVVLAFGSRGKKVPKIPGMNLNGVYYAYDIAQRSNKSRSFEKMELKLGKNAVILGLGNVVNDTIWNLAKYPQVKNVTVIARRGPFESKLARTEIQEIIPYLDIPDFIQEIHRVLDIFYRDRTLPYFTEKTVIDPRTKKEIPNPQGLTGDKNIDTRTILKSLFTTDKHHLQEIDDFLEGKVEQTPGPRVRFRFLVQPIRLEGNGDPQGEVLERIRLVQGKLIYNPKEKELEALETDETLPPLEADTFIYSIGSAVDPELGFEAVKINKKVVLKPENGFPYRLAGKERTWMAGWARIPSNGLAGDTRKDVRQMLADMIPTMQTLVQNGGGNFQTRFEQLLREKEIRWTNKDKIIALLKEELALEEVPEEGQKKKMPRFLTPLEIDDLLARSGEDERSPVNSSI